MNVVEVMQKHPFTCAANATAEFAATIMKDNDIGFLPVVEEREGGTEWLIGVITDRDLCTRVLAQGHDQKTFLVEECMTYAPITCEADDDVAHVLELMLENQVRRIPVVDEEKLIGVITLDDIGRTKAVTPDQLTDTLERVCAPRGVA